MMSSSVEDDRFVMRVFVIALYISVCSCSSPGIVFPTNNPINICCTPRVPSDKILQTPHEKRPSIAVTYNEQNATPTERHLLDRCQIAKQGTKKFPWTALIQYTKANNKIGHHCAGILIGQRSVLTAAHCLTGDRVPKDWRATAVRLGEWGNSEDNDCAEHYCDPTYVDVPIERYIFPFPEKPEKIDIAILTLQYDVRFTSTIQPACLPAIPKGRLSLFGERAYISARRKLITEPVEPRPVESIDITSWDVCTSRYEWQNVTLNTQTHICALSESGIDTCEGDSGGGLYIEEGSEFTLVGVLSFGPSPCGTTGLPAVYTRIDYHMPFIRRYMM